MYQREAMWISFSAIKPCAVKVSVGGINALTGTPRDKSTPGTQDYLALGPDNQYSQLYDGFLYCSIQRILTQFLQMVGE